MGLVFAEIPAILTWEHWPGGRWSGFGNKGVFTVRFDRELWERFNQLLAQKYFKAGIVGIATLLVLLVALEFGLNLWVRTALRTSLIDLETNSQISADLSWFTFGDLAQGRVRFAKVRCTNCKISDLSLSNLDIDSQGFRFDLPLLLRRRELRFLELRQTTVQASLTDKALSRYLRLNYPEYNLDINILPDRVRLTGVAAVFGNTVPLLLEGNVAPVGTKNIRFYPDKLLVSGRSMGSSVLKFLGEQVPLEFPLLAKLPLRLNSLRLKPGGLELSWRDLPLTAGTEALTAN